MVGDTMHNDIVCSLVYEIQEGFFETIGGMNASYLARLNKQVVQACKSAEPADKGQGKPRISTQVFELLTTVGRGMNKNIMRNLLCSPHWW
jgi:hypothetical protein